MKDIQKCHFCGNPIEGKKYSVYDENYNTLSGEKQCEGCFAESLNIEP